MYCAVGMFLWIKLKGIDDTKSLIEDKAVAAKVRFVCVCTFGVMYSFRLHGRQLGVKMQM